MHASCLAVQVHHHEQAVVHAGTWLLSAGPGGAVREVQLPDGQVVNAYELDVALQVCSSAAACNLFPVSILHEALHIIITQALAGPVQCAMGCVADAKLNK